MANKLDLADAQLQGYAHGKRGYWLTSLVGSMGLTKSEWKKWKKNYPHCLNEIEIKEIDKYLGVR